MHQSMSGPACYCSRLRRSARSLTVFYDQALDGTGLTTPQFALLRTLDRIGPAPLSELAQASGHDRTTLNRTLRPLEEAGLIESGACTDQRKRILKLTEAGNAAIRRALPHWHVAQQRIADLLGDDAPRLGALLDRLESIRV